jgi:hypothetical protein
MHGISNIPPHTLVPTDVYDKNKEEDYSCTKHMRIKYIHRSSGADDLKTKFGKWFRSSILNRLEAIVLCHSAVVADPARPSSISAPLDLAAWILKSLSVPLVVKVAVEAEDLLSVGGGAILAALELFYARNTR